MALASDLSDLSDKKGAPVFALTGYAATSLGIPRGFAKAQCGVAMAKSYRWEKQTETNPAARLEESAAVPTGKSVRDF